MKFPPTRLRWFFKSRRGRVRNRFSEQVDPIFSTLERRELLSSMPVAYGPIAPSPSIVDHPSTNVPAAVAVGPFLFEAQGPKPSLVNNLWKELIEAQTTSMVGPPGLVFSMTQSTLNYSSNSNPSMIDAGLHPRIMDPIFPTPIRPAGSHSGLSEANIQVAGKSTPELAVLDDLAGTVKVIEGNQVIFIVSGLNHPESVKLADLNRDGTPDLIIADSGNNRVLVYPGQSGGGFGSEVTGGLGVPVGDEPAGLTVGDLSGDGQRDLVVANKGSNDVTVLLGHGTGSGWSLTPGETVKAGIAPVRTLIVNPDQGSSKPDLLICNSGSGDVYFYQTTPSGQLETQPSEIIKVGSRPSDFFVGRFSLRPELDLVTINSGSDNLTFIGGVFSPHPDRQLIATGISRPISAVPLTISTSGVTDLMLADAEGRIALLQAGDNGLQLTGLVAPTGLNHVAAIAAGDQTATSLNIYEASTDVNSIAILQFNLGEASVFGGSPSTNIPTTINADDHSLVVEMITTGNGMLDLVGVLWNGSNQSGASEDPNLSQGQSGARSLGQSLSSPTNTWDTDSAAISSSSDEAERDEPGGGNTSTSWSRFVIGLDAAFDSFQGGMTSMPASDSFSTDDWFSFIKGTSRLARYDQNSRSSSERSLWFDSSVERLPGDTRTEKQQMPQSIQLFRPIPNFEGNTSSNEPSELATAVVGSAVAVRLLIKASPPSRSRPRPATRGSTGSRNEANPSWPEVFPPRGFQG